MAGDVRCRRRDNEADENVVESVTLTFDFFGWFSSPKTTEDGLNTELRAEAARSTGRRHAIKFETLDVESLRELVRLVRDLEHEKQAAVNRARMMPWRG